MSRTMSKPVLPSAMEETLKKIRRRQAGITVVRAGVIGLSVLIAAMLVAMLIDWQLTLFDTGIRTTLTATALLLAVGVGLLAGIAPLRRSLRWAQAATSADAEIPQLEERWQTVVTLAASQHPPSSPTAQAMLRQVTSEAVAIGRIVEPGRVVRPTALRPAAQGLAGCALVLAGFLASDWPQTSVLMRRFWSPTAHITATQLQSATGDVIVPRGETVELVADLSGVPRREATLQLARGEAAEEAVALRPDRDRPTAFVHRVPVEDSFRYRVRAGDGQTAWHTVTAIDFPALAEVRFTVVAPKYLDRPNYEKTVIPSRVKVMQGSLLKLAMRPQARLERFELTLTPAGETNGSKPATRQVLGLTPADDGWYRFEMQLLSDVTISPQFWNAHGLTNEDRPVCRIQVVVDNAPVARVLTPTEETAVAVDDVIDIKFEAHDDHGVATAELLVFDETPTKDGLPPRILAVLPIPLGDQQHAKHLQAEMQLDLKQFELQPGTQISYAVRVTDNRLVTLESDATSSQPTKEPSSDTSEEPTGREQPEPRTKSPESPGDGTGAETDEPRLADAGSRPTPATHPGKPNDSNAVDQERTPSGETNQGEQSLSASSVAKPQVPSPAAKPDDPQPTVAAKDSSAEAMDQPAAENGDQPKNEPGESATTAKTTAKATPPTEQPNPGTKPNQERADARDRKPGDPTIPPPEKNPPRPPQLAMMPQQSESGQDAETSRRRLKITEQLTAVVATSNTREEPLDVRERIVGIDELLADVETGLTRVVNRDIPDDDRSEQFRVLDAQLGQIEATISDLRNETRDRQAAFVGLQMLDIGRSHVTPARERVFVAIREPVMGADSNARMALQGVVRARELLAALLARFDRVARDRNLADSLDQAAKMYEVYVERSQQLLREARQSRNPLERKMAIIEVDQDYLDRYAEVLTLRREMMDEFGRLLGDDPRLLARYMELIKRRRASLRDQLSVHSARQQEIATELAGWLAADEAQQGDLWALLVELRMQGSTPLAKDAAELAERIEKQLPLVLDAAQPTPAKVVKLGRQIAQTARSISLEARRQIQQPDAAVDLRANADQLTGLFGELDAALELLAFEHARETEVTSYVTSRLLESRAVADQADAWVQIADHVHQRRYHRLAEIDQHWLAIATELLRVDMLGIENELESQFQQLADQSIPKEIAERIRELQRLMDEATFLQTGATFALMQNRLKAAATLQAATTTTFQKAEELFDRIRRDVAAALDQFDVPNPNIAELIDPTLDAFLAQLEREPNIEVQLGLPNRPRNLRVIADDLMWQQQGDNPLGNSGEAARMRAKQAMRPPKRDGKAPKKPENQMTDEERQEREQARELEENLAKSLAALQERAKDPQTPPSERRKLDQMANDLQRSLGQMNQSSTPGDRWNRAAESEQTQAILKALGRGETIPDEQWNKLRSTLDDGLWQVGGRTPPEDYRRAIEQYQERIRQLTNSNEDDL